MDETCDSCKNFHHDGWFTKEPKEEADDEQIKLGECRRHAPAIIVIQDRVLRGSFPETRETNWCGEHQPK